MDTKKRKIAETERLEGNLEILSEGLSSMVNLGMISKEKEAELKKQLDWLYMNEIDYLEREPKDYFELHDEEAQ
jgi:hypothetical protein